MKSIRDFNFRNKRVLVRCDFNVPLSKSGVILDDFKIQQALATINYLLKTKAKIILMSHLGDPRGRVIERLSLARVAKRLSGLLSKKVVLVKDYREVVPLGVIVLLENLRFYPGEEKGDIDFARKLAGLADFYINDAFAVCHRNHASLIAAKFLPSTAGFLLEKEIKTLSQVRDNPQKPLVVILAGNPKGIEIKGRFVRKMAQKPRTTVLLGNLIADELKKSQPSIFRSKNIIYPPDSIEGLDIGPETIKIFKEYISKAKTIFWSGPLGKIEGKRFSNGSRIIAKAIIKSKAFSVVGGGETGWFLKKEGLTKKFNHVSTGGDAMLMFLAGEKLPGLYGNKKS